MLGILYLTGQAAHPPETSDITTTYTYFEEYIAVGLSLLTNLPGSWDHDDFI
jgi:hypothetical protein